MAARKGLGVLGVKFQLDSLTTVSTVARLLPGSRPEEGWLTPTGLPAALGLSALGDTLPQCFLQDRWLLTSLVPPLGSLPVHLTVTGYSALEGSISVPSGAHRAARRLSHTWVNDPRGRADPNRPRIQSYLLFHCGRQ